MKQFISFNYRTFMVILWAYVFLSSCVLSDFLSSHQTAGKGGGLTSAFESSFQCRMIPFDNYSGFELQLFEKTFLVTVLCSVVYCKDFI